MNKLQLYITMSAPTFKHQISFNPAEDVRSRVDDVRHALNLINYDWNEKCIFYLLSNIEQGTFVTILRTIPTKRNEYLAAWIFVPNGLEISSEKLSEIVNATSRKVSNPRLSSNDVAELRTMFAEEYTINRDAAGIVASNTAGEYAHRFYGGETGYSLNDFLGEKLYQTSYIPFKGVLLVDADFGLEISGTDLTADELREIVTLLPPEEETDFTPHIFHHVLNRPYKVALGDEIEVVWRRGGFEDVKSIITITADGMRPASPATNESRKMITPGSFLITSRSTHEPLNDCAIRVNNREIKQGVQFTNAELQNASVEIRCEGYATYSGTIDLASTAQALIQLQERRKIYRFELPVKSSYLGAPIKFDIFTKEPLNESPIEGYELLDDIQEGKQRTNHLAYMRGDGKKTLIMKALLFVLGLIVGLLVSTFLSKCSSGFSDETVVVMDSVSLEENPPIEQVDAPKTDAQPAAEQPKTEAEKKQAEDIANGKNVSLQDAIKYLDDNKTWKREDMERYPSLKGLFDDMNTMNREKICGEWASKLKGSTMFEKVAHHCRQSLDKKIPVKKAPHDPNYNKDGDFSINVMSYLYWVDRKM